VLPAAVTVEVAGDREQAMQRLVRSRPGPPQLVLLDPTMPRMDGLEVLGRIRADEGLRSEIQQLGDCWAQVGA
jgi:CheY-like chemotaxis protein